MSINKKHVSIIITIIMLISITSVTPPSSRVKADLGAPRSIYGYIKHGSNTTPIPNGITVYLLDVNTSYTDTTTTSGGTGFYMFTVQYGVDGGNIMAINCSWENQTTSTWEQGAGACNLSTLGPADNVSFYIYNESLSINVTPWNWNAGTINYNSYNNTSKTYFNLTNKGNVKINVKIHGENITWDGNIWHINDTTGENNFTLEYAKNDSSWVNIDYTNSSFRENLYPWNSSKWWFYKIWPYTYWQQFGLNLSMPTSSSPQPGGDLSVNVTFWSIKA